MSRHTEQIVCHALKDRPYDVAQFKFETSAAFNTNTGS